MATFLEWVEGSAIVLLALLAAGAVGVAAIDYVESGRYAKRNRKAGR